MKPILKSYLQLMFESTWLTVVWWIAAALAASLAGYPGVLCMTPLATIMSVFSGLTAYRLSITREIQYPLRNAALAGGLTGFFNGFVSTLIAYLSLLLPAVEDVPTPGIFAIFAAIGTLLGAILGWFCAWMSSVRRRPS